MGRLGRACWFFGLTAYLLGPSLNARQRLSQATGAAKALTPFRHKPISTKRSSLRTNRPTQTHLLSGIPDFHSFGGFI